MHKKILPVLVSTLAIVALAMTPALAKDSQKKKSSHSSAKAAAEATGHVPEQHDTPKAGHHDEGGVDAVIAQPLQHVEAGDAGHAHVGEDHVEGVAAPRADAVFPFLGRLDRVARPAKHAGHALADGLVIIDHQYARHGAKSTTEPRR